MAGFLISKIIFLILLSLFIFKTPTYAHELTVTAHVPLSDKWEREIIKNTHVFIHQSTDIQSFGYQMYGISREDKNVSNREISPILESCFFCPNEVAFEFSPTSNQPIFITVYSRGLNNSPLSNQKIEVIIDNQTKLSGVSDTHGLVIIPFVSNNQQSYELQVINQSYDRPVLITKSPITLASKLPFIQP